LGDQDIDEGIYVLKTQRYLCDSFRCNLWPSTKYSANQAKEDKMGRACSTHWGEGKFIQLFRGETWRKWTSSKI